MKQQTREAWTRPDSPAVKAEAEAPITVARLTMISLRAVKMNTETRAEPLTAKGQKAEGFGGVLELNCA